MSKRFTFSCFAILFFPLIFIAQENVGIGTPTPANRLDVQGNPMVTAPNINSRVNYIGNSDVRAFQGLSITNPGYGIGGHFTGGYKGAEGKADGGTYNGTVYGLFGSANGTAGTRTGVYGTATGGTLFNYGVHGVVTGGANHYAIYGQSNAAGSYAGYFSGRGHFTDDLRTNKVMVVDDKVGIGTLVPNTKLQIVNGSDASFTTHGFIQTGATTGWNMVIDDNEILARDNGRETDMFIQRDSGNVLFCSLEYGGVGIGITDGQFLANGYMLSVDGKIVAEEMRIQNSDNWPDYVFAEQYDLMSLEELKQSITIHRHLPNIPSAKEVADEGILIGDMQKRMMEKIEELTLYVIQLHEANEKQSKEIELLRKKLETIRSE